MSRDDDEISAADDSPIYEDHIASRAMAYTGLLATAAAIPEADALRAEAMDMLKAIRRSFKTHPAAELRTIEGGKP